MKPFSVVVLLYLMISAAYGQTAEIRVRVISAESRTPLSGAILMITPRTDPSRIHHAMTDTAGHAVFLPDGRGLYRLEVHHVGHLPYAGLIEHVPPVTDAGTIALKARTIQIDEVVIRAEAEIQQKGDTTEYLADAFRSFEDASTEDLLLRLPGLSFSGSSIRTGMNDVAEILLDGSPIPTGDIRSVLQAIPAASIERVQVFDRQSEDAEFSGFDDGTRRATINLVSRGKRVNMTTVNASAGYGESGRYEGRGAILRMDGPRRYSLLGNYLSGSGTGSGQLASALHDINPDVGPLEVNSMSPSSRRITRGMGSAGFNEQWDGGYASIGYVLTRPGSESDEVRHRTYFLAGDGVSSYSEHRTSRSVEFTHLINGRLELGFGQYNSAVFTPRITFRSGDNERQVSGERVATDPASSTVLSTSNRVSTSSGTLGGTLVLRQKFELPGRTLSLELGLTQQNGERHTDMESHIVTTLPAGRTTEVLRQTGRDSMPSAEFRSRLLFTEPVTVSSRVQFEYLMSGSRSASAVRTTSEQPVRVDPDPATSSSFVQRVTTHRAGAALQVRSGDVLFTAGLAYEQTAIGGEEQWTARASTSRTYGTLLPSVSVKMGKGPASLRVRYVASPVIPTLGQTQEVMDNAHPMFLTIGNARLRQGVQHLVDVNYSTSMDQGPRFWVSVRGTVSSDAICRAVTLFDAETVLPGGGVMLPGGELTTYVNEHGAWSTGGMFALSLPVQALASEVSLWGTGNLSSTPWFRNGARERTEQWSMSPEFTLRTTIDTTLRVSGGYALTFRSTAVSSRENEPRRSVIRTLLVEATWWATRWLSLESSVAVRGETGLTSGLDGEGARWDLACSVSPFGRRRLVLRLECHDLLNTDRSVVRTFTDSYVEDSNSTLLPRYFLMRVSYFWN